MATIRIRINVVVPEATDEQARVVSRLTSRVEELPPRERRRVRRLLRAAFDSLKILES